MAHCSPILPNISLLQDPLDSMTSSATSSRNQLQDVLHSSFTILFTVIFALTITITCTHVKGHQNKENIIYGIQFQPRES
ncbi:hypothetical protein BGZ74_004623 [Mortierella antarctica]|nr:hypothetical protein BGZ74_004623 [Mortierella antarctica]KAG0355526.1 hypothetical protein BG005_005544 [Podila minutissima]